MQQPKVTHQPQYNAIPVQQAAQPMQMDNSLALKLAALRTYLSQTLGQDADAVINRVAGVQTHQEYQTVVGKLYAIIRDYAGVRDAERFMQRFENS